MIERDSVRAESRLRMRRGSLTPMSWNDACLPTTDTLCVVRCFRWCCWLCSNKEPSRHQRREGPLYRQARSQPRTCELELTRRRGVKCGVQR